MKPTVTALMTGGVLTLVKRTRVQLPPRAAVEVKINNLTRQIERHDCMVECTYTLEQSVTSRRTGGYEQGASTTAAALVEAEQLLLNRPHHHAEQDSGSRVRLRIVALASRLSKLVKVFALQRPRGRCPVLVGANADKRIMVSSVHPNALFSFPSSNTRYNFSWFHQSSDRTSIRKCPARR